MRCDAMRCDAMQCDAMRCNAMQCDAITSHLHALTKDWALLLRYAGRRLCDAMGSALWHWHCNRTSLHFRKTRRVLSVGALICFRCCCLQDRRLRGSQLIGASQSMQHDGFKSQAKAERVFCQKPIGDGREQAPRCECPAVSRATTSCPVRVGCAGCAGSQQNRELANSHCCRKSAGS